jgi:allantoate deiminase
MSGSHLDTVPHGGNYDGTVGVILPLEALRAAKEDLKTALPLELVIWAEEEGTTFGHGMLGSRTFVGELDASELGQLRNQRGENYLEAGASHEVRGTELAKDRVNRSSVIALLEVHVEQGATLWNSDCPVAVVTAIAGRRQYRCTVNGVANHAGSTMMSDRRDALVAAAEMIVALERIGRDLGHRSVVTVGQIACHPNAVNVIADEASFAIDLRSPADDLLARADSSIRHAIGQISAARNVASDLALTESQPTVSMHEAVCAKIRRVASAHCEGGNLSETTSGALHDAVILAAHVPTAMLFVASREGVSHSPDEFSRLTDIALAGRILFDTVKDRRLE